MDIQSLPHALRTAVPDLPSAFRLRWEDAGRGVQAVWSHPESVGNDDALQARIAKAADAWGALASRALGAPVVAMHAQVLRRHYTGRPSRLPNLADVVTDALLTHPDLPWSDGVDQFDAVIAISILAPGSTSVVCTPWRSYTQAHPFDFSEPWHDRMDPIQATAQAWARQHRRRIDALGVSRVVIAVPMARPSQHQRMAAFARGAALAA